MPVLHGEDPGVELGVGVKVGWFVLLHGTSLVGNTIESIAGVR